MMLSKAFPLFLFNIVAASIPPEGDRPVPEKLIRDTKIQAFDLDEQSDTVSAKSVSVSSLYDDYGCFYHDKDESAFISEPLSTVGGSVDQRAQECNDVCDTKHFAISSSMCFCYVEAPKQRLAIGSCNSVSDTNIKKDEIMDAFFKGGVNDQCNQEITTAVRNFFVEEDDAPFGYDISTNSYRLSPFELYKDECGTNIYEVQTEVSEGSNILTTVAKEVSEFAEERRLHVSTSIAASASASAEIPFIINAGAEVSASLDNEVNELLKYSGSSTIGSTVFTSFVVKRIAEVKLVDFDNNFNFVTFKNQFANLLRRYRDSGFDIAVAEEMFDKYGMFVVERGLFGGYRQLRSTATSDDFEQFSSSENDFRLCYEAAMAAKGGALFGLIKAEAGGEIQGCNTVARSKMERLQRQFSQEVTNEVVQGGQIIDLELGGGKSFVVSPGDSILLTDQGKYPQGDSGIKLRLLTDFLIPEKISPLEVKRHLITEKEFGVIQSHLETHVKEVLEMQVERLDECPRTEECAVPYLEQSSETGQSIQCACYTPEEPEPISICPDGKFQPNEDKFYTIQTSNSEGGYWKSEHNIILSVTGTQNEAKSHWKFQSASSNWMLMNGQNGEYISSIDSSGRLKMGSIGMAIKVTCQGDGTIKLSESSGTTSRFAATVKNFSQSTSCRYPTFLDSCKDEFGITYAKETKYRKCGPLDNKRYRVCTQTSVVLPKRETLKKTTRCDFPKFLEDCDEAFGSGWRQYGRSKCGAKKRRRKCLYQTVDRSSSFFVARIPA